MPVDRLLPPTTKTSAADGTGEKVTSESNRITRAAPAANTGSPFESRLAASASSSSAIVPSSAAMVARSAGFAVSLVAAIDRKSVVLGKSVSVRVDLGGRLIIKKKNKKK